MMPPLWLLTLEWLYDPEDADVCTRIRVLGFFSSVDIARTFAEDQDRLIHRHPIDWEEVTDMYEPADRVWLGRIDMPIGKDGELQLVRQYEIRPATLTTDPRPLSLGAEADALVTLCEDVGVSEDAARLTPEAAQAGRQWRTARFLRAGW